MAAGLMENLVNGKNVQNVTVAWDMGHTGDYRTGQDGKYDLALLNMSSGLGTYNLFHHFVQLGLK